MSLTTLAGEAMLDGRGKLIELIYLFAGVDLFQLQRPSPLPLLQTRLSFFPRALDGPLPFFSSPQAPLSSFHSF
jgi:hypothetical protein